MLKVIFTIGIGLSLIFGLCILDTATSEYDNGTIIDVSLTKEGFKYVILTENNGNVTVTINAEDQVNYHYNGDSVQVKKNILGIWRIVGEPV